MTDNKQMSEVFELPWRVIISSYNIGEPRIEDFKGKLSKKNIP